MGCRVWRCLAKRKSSGITWPWVKGKHIISKQGTCSLSRNSRTGWGGQPCFSSDYQSPELSPKGGILRWGATSTFKGESKNAHPLALWLISVACFPPSSHGNQPPNPSLMRQICEVLCVMTRIRPVAIPGGKRNPTSHIAGLLVGASSLQRWRGRVPFSSKRWAPAGRAETCTGKTGKVMRLPKLTAWAVSSLGEKTTMLLHPPDGQSGWWFILYFE